VGKRYAVCELERGVSDWGKRKKKKINEGREEKNNNFGKNYCPIIS
jgi:hypothetical protein